MASGTDSVGHRYVEFDMSNDEQVRATYIPHQDWDAGPTIRVHKRAYTGKVSPGARVPEDKSMNLIAAITELVTNR